MNTKPNPSMKHLPAASRFFAFFSILGIFLAASTLTQAASTEPVTLVSYPFTVPLGGGNNDKPTPRNVVDGLDSSIVSWKGSGGGIGSTTNNNLYVRLSSTSAAYTRSVAATETGAVDSTLKSYWAFTLTPDDGKSLNLASLVAGLGVQTISGAPSQDVMTAGFFLRSSLDGFTTNIANDLATSPLVTASGGGTLSSTIATFSFAGELYQNITAPVEFHI